MGRFAILEFGGQHTDLIGSRLEAMRHRVDYLPSNAQTEELDGYDGVVLSGGPKSVYESDAYPYDPKLFTTDKQPKLFICYGMQLMARDLGGQIYRGREYGGSQIKVINPHPFFDGIPKKSTVWNNHGDAAAMNEGSFDVIALSDKNIVAAIASGRNIGVQFHPELTHTEYGTQMLRNFAEGICMADPEKKVSEDIDIGRYAQQAMQEIKEAVGRRKALVYLSGGVDSTAAYMLAVAAGVDVVGVHIDTGLQRQNEAATVKKYLEELSGRNVTVLDCSHDAIAALQGLSDPEDKRKAFRAVYNKTASGILRQLGLAEDGVVFIDGTLATDRRESGKEASRKTSKDKGTVATIKTHHNVEKKHGLNSVEPLRYLSKDQVRRLAKEIGLPDYIAHRQPFPGPGLSVRMICGTYPFDDELDDAVRIIASRHGLDGYVMPIKTVGIKGDARSFEHLALVSGERDWKAISRASKELAEELPINRAVFMDRYWADDTFNPNEIRRMSSGVEMSRRNIALLQEATKIAESTFEEYGIKPAQLPVIAFPMPNGVGIAIRDVDSKDFRSVRPLKTPEEAPWDVFDTIAVRIAESQGSWKYGNVEAVVRDVSTKPAATTEWE